MSLPHPPRATIARLRIRGGGPDAIVARLRVEALLEAAPLVPTGLPPAAILCVRHLTDPLPGVLALGQVGSRPPAAWERALAAEMERLARGAARPAREVAPADAEAVVFADRAELLACLGRDRAEGRLGARWWWRDLLGDDDRPRAALAAFRDAAEHVPAALEALAARGELVAFARALGEGEAREIRVAVVARFGLAALARALAAPRAPPAAAPAPALERERPPAIAAGWARPAPPWRSSAPEAEAPGVGVEVRLLLGVALTLRRAPAAARAGAFAEAAAAWWDDRVPPQASPDGTPPLRAPDAPSISPRRGDRAVPPGSAPSDVPAVAERGAAPAREDNRPPTARAAEPAVAARSTPDDRPAPPVEPPPLLDAPEPAEPAVVVAPPPADAAPGPRPAIETTPPALLSLRRPDHAFGPGIRTRWGGIFYLINVFTSLDLYPEIQDGEDLAPPLFELLALVGRALLDGAIDDDPVWALVDQLAGLAPGEAPGARFTPPDDLRLPPRWLSAFGGGGTFHAEAGRLIVEHAAGFTVVDVARDDTPLDEQAARETARYAGHDFTAGAPGAAVDNGWLARLVAYVRARLGRALGVPPAAAGRFLLDHQARVHVTDTHIDVVLSLERLPIAIRLAGLDRDPRWLPAAGRFVSFHFGEP
jgi:hypothetical protein